MGLQPDRHPARPLPKLSLDERLSLGGADGSRIVRAIQKDHAHEVSAWANNVESVIRHSNAPPHRCTIYIRLTAVLLIQIRIDDSRRRQRGHVDRLGRCRSQTPLAGP